jgi:omega-6 fatty acid desaturase (delta-12 desaturase)
MSFNPIVIITRGKKPSWYQETAPYARASMRVALWQLFSTIIPYAVLFFLMVQSVQNEYSYLVTLALAVFAATLFVRIFIFFHDCTHGSFAPSPHWNRIIGYFCGMLTFTVFHDWRRNHYGHHITVGDLDRRGLGDITLMTVAVYHAASMRQRVGYWLYRHPVVTFGIDPTYYFLLRNRYPSKGAKKPDIYSVIAVDLALLAIITLAILTIGWRTFLLVQGPILIIAASIGIWLFYSGGLLGPT